jgi:hypothetical protein
MNIHDKELCVKLVIYKDYTEMHGQQNIKKNRLCCLRCTNYQTFRATCRKTDGPQFRLPRGTRVLSVLHGAQGAPWDPPNSDKFRSVESTLEQTSRMGDFKCAGTLVNVKVKVTLVQALRLCTGRTAHRGSKGIALLFHDQR